MPARALTGIRVLDLAGEKAALAGRILADLGAEVILVEPRKGCAPRWLAPFVDGRAGVERSYQHLYFNANKKSVVLDFEEPSTADRFRSLAQTADILIEASQPGEMERIGLGYHDLRILNPRLIYVSVSPFGQTGPKRDWKATDLVAEAAAGLLQICGEAEDPPTRGPGSPAYVMAGLAAAAGSLVALQGRAVDKVPFEAHVDVSLQEATMAALVQSSNPNHYLWRGEIPTRPALSQAMRCADGKWAAANILGNRIEGFIGLLDETGISHTLTPDNWTAMQSRKGAWQFLENPIQHLAIELASRLPREEFLQRVWDSGSAAMPIYSFPEMLESEHYLAVKQFEEVANDGLGVPLSFCRSPVDAVEPRIGVRLAPILGAHTEAVLGSLPSTIAVPPAPAPAPRRTTAWLPLKGIRVIDFTWVAAGPYGTRLLADFGADVIKVESSKRIDSLRNQPMPDGSYHHDLPDLFNDVNAGKRSVTIDLTTRRGTEVARQLIASADVVVDNYTAGSLARMGFAYESLKATNPGLVMLHLPGIGGQSPWASKRSLGNLLMAASGMNFLTGFEGRPPRGMGLAYPDFTTPFLTVSTVLACLVERRMTGHGREMELSQLSASVALVGADWMQFRNCGQQAARPGNRDANYCPHGVYPAAGPDRWIAISITGDDEWRTLAKAVGGEALAADGRFRDFAGRKANEDALDALLQEWTKGQDRLQLAERLQSMGIPASAVQDLRDLVDGDPPARRHYPRVFQPSAPNFEIAIDANPIRFVGEKRIPERAPMFGEHTEQVLKEVLGLPDETLTELIADGVLV